MMLRLRDGVLLAETEYGVALLDEDSGKYWNLNPSGVLVLRTLLEGGTAAQAAEQLTGEFDVDIASAGADVEELLGNLQSANLVQR
jgi:hypothetical protein